MEDARRRQEKEAQKRPSHPPGEVRIIGLAALVSLLGGPACEPLRPEGLAFVPDFRPPCELGGIAFLSPTPVDLRLGESATLVGQVDAPRDLGEPDRKCQAQADGHPSFPHVAVAWSVSSAIDLDLSACPCNIETRDTFAGFAYIRTRATGPGRFLVRATARALGSTTVTLSGHVREECANPSAGQPAQCGPPASAAVLVRVRP